jgi:hypothetical protein
LDDEMQGYQRKQPAGRSPHASSLEAAGWAVLALPLLAYVVACLKTSVNIPYQDDFDSIGVFLERYVSLHGFFPRLWWILTAQHVQYKLMFLNAIVAIQYHLIGRTNYRVLQLIGDVAIPATVAILWIIFARSHRPRLERVWLFIAPGSIFLAMRYAETVNWTMSGLQNMAVIPLSLAAILFATSPLRSSFAWTLIFLVLSIAASGNGFSAALVVLFLLLKSGGYRRTAIALAMIVGLGILYAYHFHAYMVYAPVPFSTALKTLILFPFAFIGNCANSTAQAVALGLVLFAGFILLAWRGWFRVCPASFGGALFCLITGFLVDAGRYRGGLASALAGHYAMYSLLLIALEYIGVVRVFVPASLRLRSRWAAALLLAGLASMAFCLWADDRGYRNLHARQKEMIAHLILWERYPDHIVLVPDEESYERSAEWQRLRVSFQQDLRRQIDKGLYAPPYSASDPLPVRPHSPSTRSIEDAPPPSS